MKQLLFSFFIISCIIKYSFQCALTVTHQVIRHKSYSPSTTIGGLLKADFHNMQILWSSQELPDGTVFQFCTGAGAASQSCNPLWNYTKKRNSDDNTVAEKAWNNNPILTDLYRNIIFSLNGLREGRNYVAWDVQVNCELFGTTGIKVVRVDFKLKYFVCIQGAINFYKTDISSEVRKCLYDRNGPVDEYCTTQSFQSSLFDTSDFLQGEEEPIDRCVCGV